MTGSCMGKLFERDDANMRCEAGRAGHYGDRLRGACWCGNIDCGYFGYIVCHMEHVDTIGKFRRE